MMDILVFTETFFPVLGGLERNTHSLCMALIDLGYNVKLITFSESNNKDESSPYLIIRIKKFNEIIFHVFSSDFIIINGGISLKILIPAFILRKKYAVIYQSSNLYKRSGSDIKTKFENILRKWFLQKASLNIATSEFGKEQLLRYDNSSVSLINPIDSELEQVLPFLINKKFIKKYDILYAGRLIEGKGIFLLADAISKIQKVKDLSFAIIGDGSDKERLIKFLEKLAVKFSFLGFLDKEQLLSSYMESKILVVPSTSHIEGSPLVIAESIFCGTPVIVSDQPAMINAIGSAGISFKSNNVDSLISTINFVLYNEANLENMTNNCNHESSRFGFYHYKISLKKYLLRINLV